MSDDRWTEWTEPIDERMDVEASMKAQIRMLTKQVQALGDANERYAKEIGDLRHEHQRLVDACLKLNAQVGRLMLSA